MDERLKQATRIIESCWILVICVVLVHAGMHDITDIDSLDVIEKNVSPHA